MACCLLLLLVLHVCYSLIYYEVFASFFPMYPISRNATVVVVQPRHLEPGKNGRNILFIEKHPT